MKSAKALERRPPLVDGSYIMRWPLVEDTQTVDQVVVWWWWFGVDGLLVVWWWRFVVGAGGGLLLVVW